MSSKKKTVVEETPEVVNEIVETPEVVVEEVTVETPVAEETPEVTAPKYEIGSIVYVAKDTEADLNGFKLFPQYKKYTYTVEAYDGDTDVYTLRRLNLSLKLKSENVVAPDEKHDSPLIRKQF